MEDGVNDDLNLILKKGADGHFCRVVGPWAKTKLDVLETYIRIFTIGMKPTPKKKNNWDALVYVDLFSGPGRCIKRNSNKEFNGSPLLAVNAPHPFTRLYLVEAHKAAFQSLSARINYTNCKLINQDCNSAVKTIINERLTNALYLAFIDPTGLDIHFSTIKNLTDRLPCDLIINWFSSAIIRNLPQWHRTIKSNRLDAFFGTSKWKSIIQQPKNDPRQYMDLVDLYKSSLASIGYHYQGELFPIKITKGRELYALWYASKSKTGLKFWREALKHSGPNTKTLFD